MHRALNGKGGGAAATKTQPQQFAASQRKKRIRQFGDSARQGFGHFPDEIVSTDELNRRERLADERRTGPFAL